MSKNKITIAPATTKEEFDDRNAIKDKLDSKPATVEVALNQPTLDEAAGEVVNALNGDPVGTKVPIVEMDWA